jgi:phosphoribosyl-ATP pyrophosphohydrolase
VSASFPLHRRSSSRLSTLSGIHFARPAFTTYCMRAGHRWKQRRNIHMVQEIRRFDCSTERAFGVEMDTLVSSDRTCLDPIHQLEDDLRHVADDPARFPRTTKLLAAGPAQQAKKMVEEATELAIEAVRKDRDAAVREGADLVYNLVVLLEGMGIAFDDICRELERRRLTYGIAAKPPKASAGAGEASAAK